MLALLFVMFQAVFTWAKPLMDGIEAGIGWLGAFVATVLPDGLLQSLIVDGVISGVGSVLVFLPQILILFLFIIALEDFGYMARAAFLMDKIMGRGGAAWARLHSPVVQLRLRHPGRDGGAGDRFQARPPDHHPGRTADDLLGAHPGLYADHRRLHSEREGVGASPICRGW